MFGHQTQLLQQALLSGSRSSIMKDLAWLVGLCVVATIGSVWTQAADWLIVMFAGFAGASILLFGAVYVFFALNDPDCLRSEKFTLEKLAIQHRLQGDSEAGFVEIQGNAAAEPPLQIQGDQVVEEEEAK